MSRPRQANVAQMEVPLGGINATFPLAKMPTQVAPYIQNFEPKAGYMQTPLGVEFVAYLEASTLIGVVGGLTQNNTVATDISAFALIFKTTEWNAYHFRINSFTKAVTFISEDTLGDPAGPVSPYYWMHCFNYGNFIVVFSSSGGYNVVNASNAWTGSLTWFGANETAYRPLAIGGCSHNGHLYTFLLGRYPIYFAGSAGFISGALQSYSVSTFSSKGWQVASMFSFTLSSGLDSQSLLGVFFDTGELFVFSGLRPDASDWALKGKFQVGAPTGFNAWIEANGDVLLITKQGIVSVRTLVTSAQGDAYAATISKGIEPLWKELIETLNKDWVNTSGATHDLRRGEISTINGSFHQTKNQLCIFIPRIIKPNPVSAGEAGYNISQGVMCLIYDYNYGSWQARAFKDATKIPGPDYAATTPSKIVSSYYHPPSDRLLFGSSDDETGLWDLYNKNGDYYDVWGDTPADDRMAIDGQIISAPIPAAYNRQLRQWNITQSGSAAQKNSVRVKSIGDVSRIETAQAGHSTLAAGTSRDAYAAGLMSELIQYQLDVTSGTTEEQPYQIVNISALLEEGGLSG